MDLKRKRTTAAVVAAVVVDADPKTAILMVALAVGDVVAVIVVGDLPCWKDTVAAGVLAVAAVASGLVTIFGWVHCHCCWGD